MLLQIKIMDELINKFEEQSIKGQFFLEHPDNKNNYKDIDFYYVSSIVMSYYQLLCIFDGVPIINQDSSHKYEWIITLDDTNYCFKIYGGNHSLKLKDTTLWNISCNTFDEEIINDFLINLDNALECYNTFYKQIEKNDFTHEDPHVNEFLQENYANLQKKISLFKTL